MNRSIKPAIIIRNDGLRCYIKFNKAFIKEMRYPKCLTLLESKNSLSMYTNGFQHYPAISLEGKYHNKFVDHVIVNRFCDTFLPDFSNHDSIIIYDINFQHEPDESFPDIDDGMIHQAIITIPKKNQEKLQRHN